MTGANQKKMTYSLADSEEFMCVLWCSSEALPSRGSSDLWGSRLPVPRAASRVVGLAVQGRGERKESSRAFITSTCGRADSGRRCVADVGAKRASESGAERESWATEP
jgi:hypothetical protein